MSFRGKKLPTLGGGACLCTSPPPSYVIPLLQILSVRCYDYLIKKLWKRLVIAVIFYSQINYESIRLAKLGGENFG